MRYSEEELDELSNPLIKECHGLSCNNRGFVINDRAGRMDKKERTYRRNPEHLGKKKTLRDKRRFSIKQLFDV